MWKHFEWFLPIPCWIFESVLTTVTYPSYCTLIRALKGKSLVMKCPISAGSIYTCQRLYPRFHHFSNNQGPNQYFLTRGLVYLHLLKLEPFAVSWLLILWALDHPIGRCRSWNAQSCNHWLWKMRQNRTDGKGSVITFSLTWNIHRCVFYCPYHPLFQLKLA